LSVDDKRAMIEPKHKELSVFRQCELIGLPRSSYYREILACGESEENLALMRLIDEEYTIHPFYGTRQMRNCLRRRGYKVNRKRVQRLMRLMGIQSTAPKPNTSKPFKKHKIYPYLLRGLEINRSNQVWCSDITYLRMRGGFVYLTAVVDWYSRKVLSWEVSVTMDDSFCVSALERAMRLYGKPEIFNTDQGSQYTGSAFAGALKEHGIRISMDGQGRAIDNIVVERLWRTVKYEEVYLKDYATVRELVENLKVYFEFYNSERTHDSLGLRTPDEAYAAGFRLEEAA
jgi:putative transposase